MDAQPHDPARTRVPLPSPAVGGAIAPIVIGTAGHIDHGKSSLVRALTGIDPDRLPEERARGLTIDLGFARMRLPDGRLLGIVDVPGHERFIRNMVAGATGIDLVLLVVAADDGVMPQTREHLHIMQLLGLTRGLVALNKIDLVEPDLAELAELDVREFLRGTFLEQAPILPVSAHTGAGLDQLAARIAALAAEAVPRPADGVFRMPVQRVFSARGLGTVVTGIPVSGSTELGRTLELLPGNLSGRVRSLQAYTQPVERARAGHSTAVNLSDVDHRAVRRGMVLAEPGYFGAVSMVAARLEVLPSLERPVTDRMRVRLHTGTADPAGELVLLDRAEIPPGGSGLVQLRLDEPLVAAPGDRFVLRLLSPERTLGGGVLLEESRHRLKRNKVFVLEGLAVRERSLANPRDLLDSALSRRGEALAAVENLAREIKRPRAEVVAWLAELSALGHARSPGRSGRWMHSAALERALASLEQRIAAWFAAHPHRRVIESLQLRQAAGIDPELLDALLDEASARGTLRLEPGGRVRPSGSERRLDPALEERAARVHAALSAARFQPPTEDELAPALHLDARELRAALELLADEGRVVRIGGDLCFSAEAMEELRAAVAENCGRHGHLEIPELRDRLGTTRRFLIPLLEHLDAQGFTLRQGGHRVLKRR